jgi:hypothetical protein
MASSKTLRAARQSELGQVLTLVDHPVHLARTSAREVDRQRRG